MSDEARMRAALTRINNIRNSIVGHQSLNWSAHIYPLVEALNHAGFEGMKYDRANAAAKWGQEHADEIHRLDYEGRWLASVAATEPLPTSEGEA